MSFEFCFLMLMMHWNHILMRALWKYTILSIIKVIQIISITPLLVQNWKKIHFEILANCSDKPAVRNNEVDIIITVCLGVMSPNGGVIHQVL